MKSPSQRHPVPSAQSVTKTPPVIAAPIGGVNPDVHLPGAVATWAFLSQRLTKRELDLLKGCLAGLRSDLTRSTYLYGLKRFLSLHAGPLMSLKGEDLRTWATRQSTAMPRQTLKSTLAALQSFFSHVGRTTPSHVSPFAGLSLRFPRVRDAESVGVTHKMLTMEEVRRVLGRLEAEEARAGRPVPGSFLFRFLAMSGMRISEALSLDFHDPKREGQADYVNTLRLQPDGRYIVRVIGKSNRLREFQLSMELSEYLAQHFPPGTPRSGTPVFATHGGSRLTRHGAHWQAKQIARRFMQDLPGGLAKRFAWHHLRHGICNHLLCTLGVHPSHVARIMGHSAEILTRYYLHSTKDVLKDIRLAS